MFYRNLHKSYCKRIKQAHFVLNLKNNTIKILALFLLFVAVVFIGIIYMLVVCVYQFVFSFALNINVCTTVHNIFMLEFAFPQGKFKHRNTLKILVGLFFYDKFLQSGDSPKVMNNC